MMSWNKRHTKLTLNQWHTGQSGLILRLLGERHGASREEGSGDTVVGCILRDASGFRVGIGREGDAPAEPESDGNVVSGFSSAGASPWDGEKRFSLGKIVRVGI